ncbi:MAG: PAS domain S-box protein [Alphaproteobacteria bacterium]|nr:PAS domain S-box protein [Alphaproteobacteria bacterium]
MSDTMRIDYNRETKAQLIERLNVLEARGVTRRAQFVDLVEESLLATQIITREDKRIYVNDAFVNLFGFSSKDEIYAIPYGGLTAGYDLDRLRTMREARYNNKKALTEYDYDALKKDGTILPVQVFVRPVLWGGEKAFQRIYIDLTERKRAAQETATKTALLQDIVNATPEFLSLRDTEGRFRFLNDLLATEMNMAPEDVVGKSPTDIYGAVSGETVEALTQEAIDSRQPVVHREIKSARQKGRFFQYSAIPCSTMTEISPAHSPLDMT